MEEISNKIMKWGKEKGIDNPTNQLKKMCEETLETQEAYTELQSDIKVFGAKAHLDLESHLKEEVGDMGVVWLLLCQALGIDPTDALSAAYRKNEKRTGKTINGNFIKDE